MRRYTLLYRHAFNSRADLPPWEYVEAPPELAFRRPDLPRSRYPFGVITFGRDLTPAEVALHELREVEE